MWKNNKKKPTKIGILTYHCVYNCGAMLQAYALRKALHKTCDCEIINYAPYYLTRCYVPKIRYYINLSKVKSPIRIIKIILYGIYAYFKEKNHLRKHNFKKFQKHLKMSKKITSTEKLKYLFSDYDKIIVGSDQIWKPFNNEYCFEYFLNIDKPHFKKYSYAASAGSCFPADDIPQIKELLKSFISISVREKALSDQLSMIGIKNRVDVDPTLLLKKEDYTILEKKVKTNKNFIFVYFCKDERAIEVIDYLSKKYNAEIVFGPYVEFQSKVKFKYQDFYYLGPQEFLYCIHHAKFIVTSSFHGTVFSILYGKPFVVFDRVGAFERIRNLLSLTELNDHIFRSLDEINHDCDYKDAQHIISLNAQASYDYLEQIVNDYEG